MPDVSYMFDVAADISSGRVDSGILSEEIGASTINSAALIRVDTDWEGSPPIRLAKVWFDGVLSAEDEAELQSIVSTHNPPTATLRFHATSKLVNGDTVITAVDPEWQEVGGTVTSPDFFTKCLQNCLGRVVGQYKTQGAGAKLRLCQDATEVGNFDLPDSQGEWALMQWSTYGPPEAGAHAYVLCGQKNGADSCEVRYASVSLLEAIPCQNQ